MPIELKEFIVNLKNWEFDYSPYKVDKNEADKIIYALRQMELKLLSLEHFSCRNKGRWIPIDTADGWYKCSVCGNKSSHEPKFCEDCGSYMRETIPEYVDEPLKIGE